jgi:hypothetical protein
MRSMRSKRWFRAPAATGLVAVAILAIGTSFVTVTAAEASSGWSIQATPHPASQTRAELDGTSCPGPSMCLAVGQSTNASNVTYTLAERWYNGKWAVQSMPPLPADQYADLASVSCISTASCTAVGMQQSKTGAYATLVENWNGSGWAIEPSPSPSGGGEAFLTGVSCTAANACMAVGVHGNPNIGFAERWNGTAWSLVPTPNLSAIQYGVGSVACTSATSCVAVGFYIQNLGSPGLTLAENWNGASWNVETTANPAGTTGSFLSSVACPSPTSCTAVGFYSNGTTSLTLVETWNGISWSIVPSPNPAGYNITLLSLACSHNGTCLAVGFYYNTPHKAVALAESWTGTEWVVVKPPNPPRAAGTILLDVACAPATGYTAVGIYAYGPARQFTLAEQYLG